MQHRTINGAYNNLVQNHPNLFGGFTLKPPAANIRRRRRQEPAAPVAPQNDAQLHEEEQLGERPNQRPRFNNDVSRELRLARLPYTSVVFNPNNTSSFHHQFPGHLQRSIVRAMTTFIEASFAPWGYCDCCSCYRPTDNLKAISDAQKEAVMEQHRIPRVVGSSNRLRLCSMCSRFKPTQDVPFCPFTIHENGNNLNLGEPPAFLKNLSFMELQSIRRVQPLQTIIFERNWRQEHARGQVIYLPSDPIRNLESLLPLSPQQAKLLLVNQAKPTPPGASPRSTVPQTFNVQNVLRSLEFLQQRHPEYRDIRIHNHEQLEQLRNAYESINLDLSMQAVRTNELGEESMIHRTLPAAAGDPILGYSPKCEVKAFPHIYFEGTNAEKSPRPIALNPREYAQVRIRGKNRVFQSDPSWLFRALLNVNRWDMNRKISFITSQLAPSLNREATNNITSQQLLNLIRNPDPLNADVIHWASTSYKRTLGKTFRGSAEYWKDARNHLFSMMSALGPGTFFITLGSNDVNWFELFATIDKVRFSTPEAVAALSDEERTTILNQNPAIAAEFFYRRVNEFLKFIKSEAKPLGGKVRDYFVRIEFQMRGSPHAHMVVWVEDAPDPESQPLEFIAFIDKVISAEVPRNSNDPALEALVRMYQRHNHTFTCKVTNPRFPRSGNTSSSTSRAQRADDVADPDAPAREQQERSSYQKAAAEAYHRSHCRFGYPHPLADRTHWRTSAENRFRVRGDRDIVLKRTQEEDRYINNYNAPILRIWRSNMDIQPLCDPYAAAVYMMSYITKDEKSETDHIQIALSRLQPDADLAQILRQMGNGMLSGREVSKQEASFILLGLPLYFSSRTCTYVPLSLPHRRIRRTLPHHVLEEMDLDETDVYVKNIIDSYVIRPRNEPWDSITLYEFAMWFTPDYSTQDPENQDREVQADEDPEPRDGVADGLPNPRWRQSAWEPPLVKPDGQRRQPRFTCGTKRFRQVQKARCVRFYYSKNSDVESQYTTLLLHIPFRNELADLLGSDEISDNDLPRVTREAFERFREQLHQRVGSLPSSHAARLRQQMDQIDRSNRLPLDVIPDLHIREQLENIDDDDPDHLLGADEGGPEGPSGDNIHLRANHPPPPQIDEDELSRVRQQLSSQQRSVLHIIESYLDAMSRYQNEVTQWHSREHMRAQLANLQPLANAAPDPKPVRPLAPRLFVTGPAGSGKSFLIRAIVLAVQRWARIRAIEERVPCPSRGVILCAPTGVAAHNIGGETIHSAFSLKVENKGYAKNTPLGSSAAAKLYQKYLNTAVIIIDEVSMLSARNLSVLEGRLQSIFKLEIDTRNDPRFGQRAMIFVGDFCQLRPVRGQFIFETTQETCPLFDQHLFRSYFHPIFLTLPQRQRDDTDFFALLNRMRFAKLNADDVRDISERVRHPAHRELREPEWKSAIRLFSRKRDVNAWNDQEITAVSTRLNAPVWIVKAIDKVAILENRRRTPGANIIDDGEDSAGLLDEVTLCVGAEIMVRLNIDVRDGIFNGMRGVIMQIDWPGGDAPLQRSVFDRMPETVWVHPHDQRSGQNARSLIINNKRCIAISPQTREFPRGGMTQERTQLPFAIAFAVTVHKSQSLTLDNSVIDIGESIFQAGMSYTALSRVRSLDHVIISRFSVEKIKVAASVVQEYERLNALPSPPEGADYTWATARIDGQVSQEEWLRSRPTTDRVRPDPVPPQQNEELEEDDAAGDEAVNN